jgi:hypothetical protein
MEVHSGLFGRTLTGRTQLLRRFDFTLVDPTNPWKSYNAAFFIQSDLNVKVTRRAVPV